MVKARDTQLHVFDKTIDSETWLAQVANKLDSKQTNLLRSACVLAQLAGENEPNFFGESCFHQGLVMADILASLNVDQDTIAAAILHSSVQYADLRTDDVHEHLGNSVTQLIKGACKMDAASTFELQHNSHHQDRAHVDNVRHMLLAMVEDVRVVLIKLAERTYTLRAATIISENSRKQLAQEALAIYAPLASRLGIAQIKWELEDLAFRYLQSDTYKEIAKMLDQKRIDREKYVAGLIATLQSALEKEDVNNAKVYGRAKHIYSIYRKMQRKNVDFSQIYDAIAVRILVDSTEDCYKSLSCVHSLWQHIPEEFDDYIATPKANGYRSIHTAVRGPENRNVEVQIRTNAMHEECELGVAAHWVYKEGSPTKSRYEQKITWLRQVLEWQSELAKAQQPIEALRADTTFDDRIYVFTPAGHVVDLPHNATPLDFAYHIHSDVGHRCRGAKVNGHIVPLTYLLQTGEQVEIITGKIASPSRDWLNPHAHYVKSSRAKAKIHHWFKQQDYQRNILEGENLFARESRRLHLHNVNLDKVAEQLHYKNKNDLFAGLGCGDLRINQLLSSIQRINDHSGHLTKTATTSALKTSTLSSEKKNTDILIDGVGHLLTYIAKCCHPVPGDPIVGYIAIGRGITIHHQQCPNIQRLQPEQQQRITEVSWGQRTQHKYPVTIVINTNGEPDVLNNITHLLSKEKLNLLSLTTNENTQSQATQIELQITIYDLNELSQVLGHIQRIAGVIDVIRRLPSSE